MDFGRDHGDLHWVELMTADTAKATAHYTALCGWSYDEMDMGMAEPYRIIKRGDQVVGGLSPAEPGVPTGWLPYFAVEDADAAATRLAEGGGGVARPPFDVPGVGRIVIGRDATGALVGLIQPAAPQG